MGQLRSAALWIAIGLAGLGVTGAATYATSHLSRQEVGQPSAPPLAGADLAPDVTTTGTTPRTTTSGTPAGTTPRSTTTPATTTPTTTTSGGEDHSSDDHRGSDDPSGDD